MELHHTRTGRGMQHEAALERASNKKDQKAATAKSGEQEDGVAGEKETPTKRKGGRGKKPGHHGWEEVRCSRFDAGCFVDVPRVLLC